MLSKSRIITTETNDNPMYIDFTKVFLASLAANASDEKVRVNVSGWSEKEVEITRKINPMAEILPIEFNKRININGRYTSVEDYIEIVHVQATVMRLALEDGYDKVAHFDVDTLILRNLDKLWDDVDGNVLKIIKRPGQPKKRRFQNGIYVIGNSKYTRKMIQKLEKKIVDSVIWYDDQKQLYKCYTKIPKIKLIELSKKYNDRHFKKGSFVWHCCHKNKTVHKKWNKQFKKYL